MRYVMVAALALPILIAGAVSVPAEEGMWSLEELNKLDFKRLEAMGLELSAGEIYDSEGGGIAYAVVDLKGGTGSFVSPEGLILTNHHVAFYALQRVSTAENNYIVEGFSAEGFEEEIPAPGYRAYVLKSIKDVTEKVLGALEDEMTPFERNNAIERRTKELIGDEEDGRDVECRVESFFGGMQYRLFTFFAVKDVRIVYAPPRSIGNYGGEIDNWMWPRHTGDFSFLRAYVAPDGSSAEYAEENVPYRPGVYLAFSSNGVEESDFTMILGYPARTNRYLTSYAIDNNLNFRYPRMIRLFKDLLDIFGEAAEADEGVAIKVASFDKRLSNAVKNFEGLLVGLRKSEILRRRIEEEAAFAVWLSKKREMNEKYGEAIPGIAGLYEDVKTYREKAMIHRFAKFACLMLRAAGNLNRWSIEREKEDLEREAGFQERDVPRLREGLEIIQSSYDEQTDRNVLKYFLMKALELPENQRFAAVDAVVGGARGAEAESMIDAFIDGLYSGTKLHTVEERLRMFGLTRGELLEEGDPFIMFADEVYREAKALEDENKAFTGAISKLRPKLIEAYEKWKGGRLYPDANGTMRLSYGSVKGYSPRDAVHYDHLTTLSGVVEKHSGEVPFDCPNDLISLQEEGDFGSYADEALSDVPVNFLSTNDITGGNSGSPVLNSRGEIVGAAFDGNYESISADYVFNMELTRAINVDARYILFILDEFSGAGRLLDEITVK